jgi:hypothetical protein
LEESPTTRDGLNQTPAERRERVDDSDPETFLSTIYEVNQWLEKKG